MIELDEMRKNVLASQGHIIVMGGPGSGKTTIALIKAKKEVERLKCFQKILFLSFARATVMRVADQGKSILNEEALKYIKVSTYHAFEWEVLKSNAKLVSSKSLSLLAPHEAASKFRGLTEGDYSKAIKDEFERTGKLHFDLFAPKLSEFLSACENVLQLLCDVYPIIILDEFQDTNQDEWDLIQLLGKYSTLVILADPEQRIYDFRGASPGRVREYVTLFSPQVFDFGTSNNRSTGTDIVEFGNDLLVGRNIGKIYKDVRIIPYVERYYSSVKHFDLKTKILNIIQSLQENKEDWSLAILTSINRLMIEVSDYLESKQVFTKGTLPSIAHEIAIDRTGPSIAAVFIAALLDLGSQQKCSKESVIELLQQHILGKKNGKLSQKDEKICEVLQTYLLTGKVRGKNREALISECIIIAEEANRLSYCGNIFKDWISVRALFSDSKSEFLQDVYKDSKYIRLLRKGSLLFTSLDSIWRQCQNYSGAKIALESALSQDHFSMDNTSISGLNVMTIHKSKGKEFDVVVVYEGVHSGRFILNANEIDKARLNLRVAVTRARLRTYIFTPEHCPCSLL